MILITQPKAEYNVESMNLLQEAVNYLGWSKEAKIQVYDLYQFEDLSDDQFKEIQERLFNPKQYDFYTDIADLNLTEAFRYRQVTGQYNEQEQMTQEMIHHLLGFDQVRLYHSKLVDIQGAKEDEITRFKDYIINPVENTIIPIDEPPFQIHASITDELNPIEGFIDMDQADLEAFSGNFSMDMADMQVVQDYFQIEGRNPNLTELKVIDTYWSDHCRHTTFNTHIDQIDIQTGPYEDLFKAALSDYLAKRSELGRENRPITLMDLATIQSRYLREQGMLDNLEVSQEINACALEIKVDVDGQEEDWILYFKNETHNHPTEIEPFGGASTCVGGGVRDPLSGRSWVYQAMRVSGAKDPTLPLSATHPDKLPQRTISKRALAGNSDYSNQIGVTAAHAQEVYHPGFEAKRLEAGALISAGPRQAIVRKEPQVGDRVVLLGGRTGRDGLGAAVGSSQEHTEASLENAGAEVQKGAAAVERKIARLFRRTEASRLITRCNDFGAGGVAVAVGELADGLQIDLDQVPVKYPGMHGGEIAISESQERMAVIIPPRDLEEFLRYCREEDVEHAVIAEVTDNPRMIMTWQGQEIINLSREFLDSNGATKNIDAELTQPEQVFVNDVPQNQEWNWDSIKAYVSNLNRADQKAINSNFDASINASSVLYPYGGVNRSTQELGMVSKLPVPQGKTQTVSGMAFGYDPYLAVQSPFHGGYYAVIESVSRMVALGFNYQDLRLTFQEFFEALRHDPQRWGKPVLALLGANTAMSGLNLAAVGGKDSMSGSFEDIDVPPTLISFAVAQGQIDSIQSRAFKEAGSQVVLIENPLKEDNTLDLNYTSQIYQGIYQLAKEQAILAISTVGFQGLLKEIIEMSYGNSLGVSVREEAHSKLGQGMMGSFILEISPDHDLDNLFKDIHYQVIGQTQNKQLTISGQSYSIIDIYQASQAVFAPVFDTEEAEDIELATEFNQAFKGGLSVEQPQALIPVLYGSNGEYDMEYALQRAGFQTQTIVIKDSSYQAFQESLTKFITALQDSHLLALANGYIFGSEPQEAGRAWEIIFQRPDVKAAIHEHLRQKRLIIGNGSALATLIRTGLIEHGKITGETNIQLLPNQSGNFYADLTQGQVISNASAFTRDSLGYQYTAPIAHRYGRIDLGPVKNQLHDQGQVLAYFNHAYTEIDALTSPDGLILGSVSLFDRVDQDLYKNAGTVSVPPYLQEAFQYFNQ